MREIAESILALGILGMMAALIAPSIREPVVRWFENKPKRIWILPTLLTLHYSVFTFLNHFWRPEMVFRVALYFFAITLIIHHSRRKQGAWNFLLISALLIPPVLSFLPRYWGKVIGIDFPGGVFATSLYLLIALPFWRNIDLNARWSLKASDIAWIPGIYIALFVVIFPIATLLHFIHPGFTAIAHNSVPRLIYIFTLGIFLKTGLVEELVFRGMIQNLILRKLRFLPGLLLSSFIFGLTHIGQHTPNGMGTTFSFPNWRYVICATIAGIGYGYVYEKRKSLVGASLLHAMVDFTWKTFLSG